FDWRRTGADTLAVDDDRTCAALCETAAELRAIEREVVTQDVKQRCVGFCVGTTGLAVDLKTDGHGVRASPTGALACTPLLGCYSASTAGRRRGLLRRSVIKPVIMREGRLFPIPPAS